MGREIKGRPLLGGGAPFGGIGRMLGFRWLFFFTFPVPFHPLLLWALLLSPAALALHRAHLVLYGNGGGVTPFGLLIAAAVLAVPMSIPIVNWVALAYRLPLVQSLFVAAAMVLFTIEVAAGHSPAWQAVFPAAYVLLFLIQRIGGPIYLRRLEAANARFEPITPGQRQVVVENDSVGGGYGSSISKGYDVAEAVSIVLGDRERAERMGLARDRRCWRLSETDFERAKSIIGPVAPEQWTISNDPADPILTAPGAEIRPDAIRVRKCVHQAPLGMITGRRTLVELTVDGNIRRLVRGEAALIGNWPLLVFFRWVSITDPGSSQWTIGFPRRKPVQIGSSMPGGPLREPFPPAPPADRTVIADAAPLLVELEQAVQETRAEMLAIVDKIIASIGEKDRRYFSAAFLKRYRHHVFGQGERLIEALGRAEPTGDKQAVRTLGWLLGELPHQEFQSLGPKILDLLNSKRLAFRLLGGPDPAIVNASEAERREQAVMSYNLINHAPRLYQRLGELGEAARPLVTGLGELGRWPEPLVRARDELDRRRAS